MNIVNGMKEVQLINNVKKKIKSGTYKKWILFIVYQIII